MNNNKKSIIKGSRLQLRRLVESDANETYLAWLNDLEIQNYTRRRNVKTTMPELESFIRDSKKSKDLHFAIIISENNKHIGNLFIVNINEVSKNAELTIMIGDKEEQGKGYAKEAIGLATQFAFKNLNLHRFYAGSPSSVFNGLIKKIGWTFEGKNREAFLMDDNFIDTEKWSILETEWKES